jgi:paraquat-inducible protein B
VKQHEKVKTELKPGNMSKKANPTLIGLFVIGAITLLVISLIVLGTGKIFSERSNYVTYFDGSIQGLRQGANVTFRGVRIGQVRNVFVQFDESMKTFDLPVVIELDPKAIQTVSGNPLTTDKSGELLAALIDRGLRAKLQMESFVTGQLLVDLDFYPDEPVILRGQNDAYSEIPTIPSDIQLALANMQRIIEKLQGLPVEALLENLISTMSGIEKIVQSPELINAIKNIDNTFAGIDNLVNSSETQLIATKLFNSIERLDSTISEIKSVVQQANQHINPIAEDMKDTISEAHLTVTDIQKIFQTIRKDIEDETIRHELNITLNELRNAAQAFRVFIEYLDTRPEALIQGKPNE